MLKISNIHIKYDGKSVLFSNDFKAPQVGICVIYGESGSGKTSLLKSIQLQEYQFEKYSYNGRVIDRKERDDFKNQHISSLSQTSVLIDSLKIKDHFRLFEVNERYIKRLKLDQLMEKYPSQLSGGEKTRVGLALAMMQSKAILLLDEPTASIDADMEFNVISLIKEYAKDHLIIISTHDKLLMNIADCLYYIENCQLVLERYEPKENDLHEIIQPRLSFSKKLQLFYHIHQRQKLSYIIMQILLVISISFTSFGLSKVFSHQNYDESLNDLMGTEILVYKPVDKNISPNYYMDGREFPINREERETIGNIEHVASVDNSIDLELNTESLLPEIVKNKFDSRWVLTLKDDNDNVLSSQLYPMNGNGVGASVLLCTYLDHYNYSTNIHFQTSAKNGIYVSHELAKLMALDENNLESKFIQLDMPIPQYVGYNDCVVGYDYETGIPACRVLGSTTQVTLPISGILGNSNMGEKSPVLHQLVLYVPLSLMEEKINQYLFSESMDYHMDRDIGHYVPLLDGQTPKGRVMHCEPYASNAVIVRVDSAENKAVVMEKLQKLGFSTSNSISREFASQFANNSESNVFMVAVTSFVLVSIVYFIIKFLNLKQEQQFVSFFHQLGWSKKASRHLAFEKYAYDCLVLILLGLLFAYVYFKVSRHFMYFVMSAQPSYPIFIVALAILLAYVYPSVLIYFDGSRK